MTPAEWERCLTFHYLRSDGPLGGAPLTFLDATPAEIAAAAADHGVTERTAQEEFVAQFTRSRVQDWLNGEMVPPREDQEIPGYFRYLVLTALVSATDDNVGRNNDFRDRLGALLGGGRLNSVAAVNSLWRALRDWCARRQALGEPIRTVVLPSYGNMNLIGYAVRIAFPAWRDRAIFARILRSLGPEVRANPERLVQELSRPHRFHALPAAVAGALTDFARQIEAKRRMLLGHRFWTLVRSIDAQLREETDGKRAAGWRLEARFGGWDQDELELRLATRSARGTGAQTSAFEGAFADLLRQGDALPVGFAELLAEGVLLLNQGPYASWIADDEGPRDDAPGLVMTRDDGRARRALSDLEWRSLGEGWSISQKLAPDAFAAIVDAVGSRRRRAVRLSDLVIDGGVRTGRGTWLGRARYLPTVTAARGAELSVEPLSEADSLLSLDGESPTWHLAASGPITGRWRLAAREGGIATVKPLVLEADAPERWDWSDAPARRFEREREIAVASSRRSACAPGSAAGGTVAADGLMDLLEALYAGAPKDGWSEAELIPLLESHLPTRHFVWDLLRCLAEAGWIEPWLALGWRARRWQLLPPTVIETAGGARLEGAVGAAARRRLGLLVADLGARIVELGRLSAWAPPALRVDGVSAARLAEALGWALTTPQLPNLAAAPMCWPEEERTTRGRDLDGVWSFDLGLFLAADAGREISGVRLERWIRDRRDDRDLYRITGDDAPLLTTSRTAAILEAHRRARRPLFQWRQGRLVRLGRTGHLPLPVARALAHRGALGSGPVRPADGGWSYGYSVNDRDAAWLGKKFGTAIGGVAAPTPVDRLGLTVAARRAGRRPVWYSRSTRELAE